MLTKKEVMPVVVSIILMTLLLMFNNGALDITIFPDSLLISALIVFIAVYAKKIMAYYRDVDVEHKFLGFQRYGLSYQSHLKKPFPAGLVLPLVISILSLGYAKFLLFLEYSSEALPSKAAKYTGSKRFSGMMEWDDAMICFYSFLAVIVLAIVSALLPATSAFSFENLARYSFYYACFNMIPLGRIDGAKLFFGSRPLYGFSLFILIIAGLIVFL